ncbi:hypothetical protein Herbaro_16785 [Herbaspirillum sp. WKF16]|jgi:hypothetical protein|uniref:hypothetical protein n=1 Tax=Herbaspirillum sp. WKF16 TaxID=3028312 RepID=UPI0023A999BC|nr:hypothetical protein [Herbaspirillum sp. WKF16]WDZ95131.1 hypothetical protein Herbaro_16785 [Herbaspirillum sp. WKF16]
MTRGNRIAAALLALGLMAGAGAASAQSAAPAYMNGGIGQGEQDAIKAAARDYNLHLLFSQNNGEYISDVRLDITDTRGGALLSLPSAGPMTNVRLPPGQYKVSASYKGEGKSQQVTVMEGKTSNLSLRWGGGATQ